MDSTQCPVYDELVKEEDNMVDIIHRNDFFDVLIDKKKVGSGTWAYVNTAVFFYRAEGMRVVVHD